MRVSHACPRGLPAAAGLACLLLATVGLGAAGLPGQPAEAGSPAATPSAAAAAWDKAAARYAAGLAWKPYRLFITNRELGADGESLSTEELEYALIYAKDSELPVSELVRAIKDGRDVTEERRKSPRGGMGGPGGQQGGPGGSFPDPLPFAPVNKDKLVRGAARAAGAEGFEFGYEIRGKPGVVGALRFDSGGAPLGLRYSLAPLPIYLAAFDGEYAFGSAPDGSLVASELSFAVRAKVLFIEKRFNFRIRFGDWRKR
ncbi:MAG: hypothetical protein JNG85_00405 [Spirochaetaceae bacterium]|nr:hypothetical protein [Spirochaetaceae bacterium]